MEYNRYVDTGLSKLELTNHGTGSYTRGYNKLTPEV